MNTQIKEIVEKLKNEIKLKEAKAKKLVLEPEAEEKLYELIILKDWLDKEIENLKAEIVNQAEKVRQNFTGFVGQKLLFRYYRPRVYYKITDPYNIEKEFVSEIIQYRANVEKIKMYKEKTGKLPIGVDEEKHPAKLEVKLRKNENPQIEAEPHSS